MQLIVLSIGKCIKCKMSRIEQITRRILEKVNASRRKCMNSKQTTIYMNILCTVQVIDACTLFDSPASFR